MASSVPTTSCRWKRSREDQLYDDEWKVMEEERAKLRKTMRERSNLKINEAPRPRSIGDFEEQDDQVYVEESEDKLFEDDDGDDQPCKDYGEAPSEEILGLDQDEEDPKFFSFFD